MAPHICPLGLGWDHLRIWKYNSTQVWKATSEKDFYTQQWRWKIQKPEGNKEQEVSYPTTFKTTEMKQQQLEK